MLVHSRPAGRKQRGAALVSGLLSVHLIAAACGSTGARPADGPAVFRLGIMEPVAIDPYNSQESEGQIVTKAIFEGLVRVDTGTSEIVPGVAERWERTSNCDQWTFHLREGTTFSNGEPVRAQSFIDGMTRAAVAEAASDTAHFMSDITGYDAIHGTDQSGATTATFSGLSAPDDTTLVVGLSTPNCEFDKKTVQPVFSPVPAAAGPADPASEYANMPIGNGPFMMKDPWEHDTRITLVRNERYYGPRPHLDEVEFTILPSENAQDLEFGKFEAGEVDYARIPPALLPRAKETYERRGEFIAEPKYGVSYLLVNVRNPPLDNATARHAISLAIDRDAVIDGVFKGFQIKATSLVPPPLKAYFQPGVCGTCETADAGRARELAREGGIPPGTALDFSFNTGGGNEAWVQAVAHQLEVTLGLDVNVRAYPLPEFLEKATAPDASGLFRAAWGADYPSADAFLRPLLSRRSLPPGDNRGRYVNESFDAMLDSASRATDEEQRIALVKQAEQMAIGEDLAVIPLWYRTQYRVFSREFSGVRMDFFENPTLLEIRPA